MISINEDVNLPFEPKFLGYVLNIHLIFEYAAFFLGFRYYKFIKKKTTDLIPVSNRLSILIGAIFGAFLGSRIVGILENPTVFLNIATWTQFLQVKSIMGGLFGGTLGVEFAKWRIGEKQSSGDLFTLPLILGIAIGRIGCFLAGIDDFTYGIPTDFFLGMNLGDNIMRHPISLYEIVFLSILFVVFYYKRRNMNPHSGWLFKYFMLSYFSFRFFIEFIKPNTFFVFGLSSIQWLCLVCWLYYLPDLRKNIRYAN